MTDVNKNIENNQEENQNRPEVNKNWWRKLLCLMGTDHINPTYRLILFFSILVLFFFIYEQYKIFNFKKMSKEQHIETSIKTGDMKFPRSNHSCITLNNGKILIIGGNNGIELFDPRTGKYSIIDKTIEDINGSLQNSILLPNGNVFIAGYYIFNTQNNKILKIKNANEFISKNNLSMQSMDAIYPVLISENNVLVFGDNIPFFKNEDKVILYDINKNLYRDYKINFPYEYKKLIGKGNRYIKEKNAIYFILSGASLIIKWNFLTNQIENIVKYPSSWQQVFVLEDKNLLLSDGYGKNNASILNLNNGKYYQLLNLNSNIYGIFKKSDSNFIIFTSSEKNKDKIAIYNLDLKNYKVQKLDFETNDNYYHNFQNTYTPQMIGQIDENKFLYAGGQVQIPLNSRINDSVVIKLGE